MLVSDVMQREVVTVTPDDNLLMVGDSLMRHRISGAFVLKRGRLVGTVSKESFLLSIRYMGDRPVTQHKVTDFMQPQNEYVGPDDPFSLVVEKINEHPHRLDRLPVLDDGKLVGVVSKGDIARVYADRMQGRFKVKDLMEYDPVIAYDFLPLPKLIEKLNISKNKQALYVQGRNLRGIVTTLDLAIALFTFIRKHPDKDPLKSILMEDVVSKNIVATKPGIDAAEAARVIAENRFGSLPVLEDDQVKGLLTTSSFVNGFKYNMEILS